MKIVLDTNCLVPVIVPSSFGHDIWQAFRTGKYVLCVSTEILLEYEEVLIRITGDRGVARINLITTDPDDNKFVDCAITAGATFIVSNDKHFAELEKYSFPKVDVRTLTEFLNIVRTL